MHEFRRPVLNLIRKKGEEEGGVLLLLLSLFFYCFWLSFTTTKKGCFSDNTQDAQVNIKRERKN